MNFPKTIKGVWNSYTGEETQAEVPIEDIDFFRAHHEPYRNGTQIMAFIKKELVDQPNYDFTKFEERKYRYHQSRFTIRGRDMPKFRKELMTELLKQDTVVTHHGINGGTPIAQSRPFARKELKIKGERK